MKGISPLIAAVLLIAVTMAIAGVMASWATTFSGGRLSSASTESQCIGSLDISALSFSNQNVTLKVRNLGDINLTGLTANIEYSDINNNILNIDMTTYGIPAALGSTETAFFNYDTGSVTKPQRIEVLAGNCKSYPSILFFT